MAHTSMSCTGCKKRKVKCSRDPGGCTTCIKRHCLPECIYPSGRSRRKSKKKSQLGQSMAFPPFISEATPLSPAAGSISVATVPADSYGGTPKNARINDGKPDDLFGDKFVDYPPNANTVIMMGNATSAVTTPVASPESTGTMAPMTKYQPDNGTPNSSSYVLEAPEAAGTDSSNFMAWEVASSMLNHIPVTSEQETMASSATPSACEPGTCSAWWQGYSIGLEIARVNMGTPQLVEQVQ